MIKKLVIGFCVFLLLALVFELNFGPKTPQFAFDKVGQLMKDKALMDSIGGNPKVKILWSLNELQKSDTFRYAIKMQGQKRTLTYEGTHRRTASDEWRLIDENVTIN